MRAPGSDTAAAAAAAAASGGVACEQSGSGTAGGAVAKFSLSGVGQQISKLRRPTVTRRTDQPSVVKDMAAEENGRRTTAADLDAAREWQEWEVLMGQLLPDARDDENGELIGSAQAQQGSRRSRTRPLSRSVAALAVRYLKAGGAQMFCSSGMTLHVESYLYPDPNPNPNPSGI